MERKKKYSIYELSNGRIYTDTIQNVAIIKNNIDIDVKISGQKFLDSYRKQLSKNFHDEIWT